MSWRGHNWVAILLFLFVGVRVWFYSCAYPVFNVSDEQAHYDLACWFADGTVPPPIPGPYSEEEKRDFILFASPEYLNPQRKEELPGFRFSQHWVAQRDAYYNDLLKDVKNPEFGTSPAYYAVAGLWHWIGKQMPVLSRVAPLPFWQRWLNVFFALALVGCALRLGRALFADRLSQWALVALMACFPSEYYYYTTPDMLAALLGALLLTEIAAPHADRRSVSFPLIFILGLLQPLNKLTAAIWVVALPLAAVFAWRDAPLRNRLWAGALGVGAGLIGFGAYHAAVYGDAWAVREKVAYLTWTVKPVCDWLDHPVFSFPGFCTFLRDTVVTFWRGELYWRESMLEVGSGMDYAYALATLATMLVPPLVVGRVWLERRRGGTGSLSPPAAACVLLGWLLLGGGLFFLGWMSIRFDFGRCFFPSRDFPFMAAGRLISTILLPFLVAHVVTMNTLLGFAGRWKALYWVVFLCCCTVFQLYYARAACESSFNWFHLYPYL